MRSPVSTAVMIDDEGLPPYVEHQHLSIHACINHHPLTAVLTMKRLVCLQLLMGCKKDEQRREEGLRIIIKRGGICCRTRGSVLLRALTE